MFHAILLEHFFIITSMIFICKEKHQNTHNAYDKYEAIIISIESSYDVFCKQSSNEHQSIISLTFCTCSRIYYAIILSSFCCTPEILPYYISYFMNGSCLKLRFIKGILLLLLLLLLCSTEITIDILKATEYVPILYFTVKILLYFTCLVLIISCNIHR